MSNVYHVIHTIDGILDRLTAVSPRWEDRLQGPTQWLFRHETQNSLEFELSQATTTLSVPSFPDPNDPKDEVLDWVPLDWDLRPLPRTDPRQSSYSVDWRLEQILSGIRSVLLVLVDSAALCCRKPNGDPDPDFVGSMDADDVFSAVRIMSSWSLRDFVPNCKYWKDWPLARFLDNPLPPCPPSWGNLSKEDPLFSGKLRRYWTRSSRFPWQHRDAANFYRLNFALAQSKRGFAKVPIPFVQAALEKHRKMLSTPPPPSDPAIVERLRRFLTILLKGFRAPSILESLVTQEASTRASNSFSRRRGGAREDIRHRIFSEERDLVPQLIRMVPLGPDEVVEERGEVPPTKDEWARLLMNPQTMSGSEDWTSLKEKTLRNIPLEYFEFPRAEVSPILEPLKVRLITAMNALRTFVATPIQKSLWTYLRSLAPFQLIGEPISTEVIREIVELHREMISDDEPEFVSGDYSSATDLLVIHYSKVVLEEIILRLKPDELFLAPYLRDILYEQILFYPKWSKLPPVKQENGQLMGSVLSFPILCIINLFTYVESLSPELQERFYQGRLPISKLPVRVNGDDILFRAGEEQYGRWLVSTISVGFLLSVGKNFRHLRFLTVNSVPLEYIPDISKPDSFWYLHLGLSWAEIDDLPDLFLPRRVDKIIQHGFLNVGLLTGQAKLTGRDTLGALPLSGWHASSVLSACNQAQAHRWFLFYHRKSIAEQTRFGKITLNLFAHPLLGGLGFSIPQGITPRYSEGQRALAHQLFLSASESYAGQSKDYALSSTVYLRTDPSSSTTILGHRRQYVEVLMYPIGTPLTEGLERFEDRSPIYPLALSRPLDPDTTPMEAACRLSNAQLKKLAAAFRHEKDLRDVDDMNFFPFLPVRVNRFRYVDGVETPIVIAFSPVDATPAQPVPTLGTLDVPITLEDWESADTRLVILSPSQPEMVYPPVRHRDATLKLRLRYERDRNNLLRGKASLEG